MRALLLELIRASTGFIEYAPALIKTTVAVITGSERYWDIVDRPVDSKRAAPTATFLRDSVLRRQLFLQASARFPYESRPFLNFCRALAFDNNGRDGMEHAIWTILDGLDTFTCSMPVEFLGYRNVRTQEENDHIELTDALTVAIAPTTEISTGLALQSNRRLQAPGKINNCLGLTRYLQEPREKSRTIRNLSSLHGIKNTPDLTTLARSCSVQPTLMIYTSIPRTQHSP